jgi:small neutral amino acid transporter SnatA (MarC family)
MAIDLLVLDNQRHVAEFFLIKNIDEVFLHVVIVSSAHYIIRVSMVLRTCAFLGDRGEATNILQTLVGLVLLLRGVQWVVTGGVEVEQTMRVLTWLEDLLLVSLRWLSNLLLVSRLDVS